MIKKVPLEPKLEYEKSCSSIGSTHAAKTDKNFIFEYYCTPKRGVKQRLHDLTRRWAR